MSLSITSIVRNANGSWTFAWDAVPGATFYRVVLWGITLASVPGLTYTWVGQEYANFPPPLEVSSSNALVLSETYQPYLLMQWYGEPTCQLYLVQQKVGSSWQTIQQLRENGSWVYNYQTVTLKDETTYNYRVIARDAEGNLSPPRGFVRYVVCPPVPPDGTAKAVYGAGKITVVPVP